MRIPASAALSKLPKSRQDPQRFERLYAFQCRSMCLPPWREQSAWAKKIGRRWTADFHFEDYQLLIEIEGGIWMRGGGAHSRPVNIERDAEKNNAAVLLGLATLRFLPREVTSGAAVAFTQKVLAARGWKA